MKELVLSVIVPVYNTAPLLRRCLDSLRHQTYPHLEIICVNDGSMDGSAVILDEYAAKDSRIHVIHQENAGVSVARNRGLDAATGEFLTFVDADDWLEPDAYEKAVCCMENDVDMVCFGTEVDGDAPDYLDEYCNMIPSGKTPLTAALICRTNASVWNKVYRLGVIREAGVRFLPGVAYGEDSAFCFCYMSLVNKVLGVASRLYHYVQHEDSAMASPTMNARRVGDLLVAYNEVYAFYARHDALPRMLPVLELLFCSFWHFAKEGGLVHQLLKPAYEAAQRSGVLGMSRAPQVLELKMLIMPPWKRIFHWYIANRECFGIAGLTFLSVTYEAERWIYRCLGRQVRIIQKGGVE